MPLNNKRNSKTKSLLEGYLFCQSKMFEKIESKILIKNLKGMQYILSGSKKDQKEGKKSEGIYFHQIRKKVLNITEEYFQFLVAILTIHIN